MSPDTRPRTLPWSVLFTTLLGLLWLWLFSAATPGASKPPAPAKRTYFVTTFGAGAPLALDAGCMTFTRRRVCLDTLDPTDPAFCGAWSVTDDGTDESGIRFEMEWDASGVLLATDAVARIDARGPGASIGGAGMLSAPELGVETNFSFSGGEVKRKECRRLAADLQRLAREWTATLCRRRASFGPAGGSPFVLPYAVGERYRLGQSYCDARGSHRDSFAYDIDMPIGTPVVAVRDGVVWMALDNFEDGDRGPEHANDIFVEHADGTVAQYAHLRHRSFLVDEGDRVVAGQTLAASGDTGIGSGAPHLHFEVFHDRGFESLPVNFRNAGGPLDERGGLVWDETYEALPY